MAIEGVGGIEPGLPGDANPPDRILLQGLEIGRFDIEFALVVHHQPDAERIFAAHLLFQHLHCVDRRAKTERVGGAQQSAHMLVDALKAGLRLPAQGFPQGQIGGFAFHCLCSSPELSTGVFCRQYQPAKLVRNRIALPAEEIKPVCYPALPTRRSVLRSSKVPCPRRRDRSHRARRV